MRKRTRLLLLIGALGCAAPGRAEQTVAYRTDFTKMGDAALDSLLVQTSTLNTERTTLPAPFALIGRAEADRATFVTVLHSLGYDSGDVSVAIDGYALNDPSLLDHLTQLPAGKNAVVTVTPHAGPRFAIGAIDLTTPPDGFSPKLGIKPGQPALAGPILDASASLQTALHNAGYAFATVSPPLAVADIAHHRLNLTYTVKPGPRVEIGAINFSGLKRVSPAFLRQQLKLKPGQRYSDTALADARNTLLGLGIFTSVTVVPGTSAAVGAVPVLFRTVAQKRHAVAVSISYATDQGFTLSTSWEDRNVFQHAETLTFTVAASGLGGTGSTAPGYDVKAVFAKPDDGAPGQTLSLSVEALEQSLTAYNRNALLLGGALSRPLSPHISLTYGPGFVDETVEQESEYRNYVLVNFPVTLAYDTADSVLEPTKGINASLTVTPTEPVQGARNPFVIIEGGASTYIPVEAANRAILALRGQLGSIQGASQFQVPADERFFAGGSGSVRGYTYQTIGPLFPDDDPEGGLAFDTASVEFRQRVGKSFGIVPFVDAGQVSAGSMPFQGTVRVGVGLGARYYTSIGPIRADIAFPLTRVAGSGGFALYIGLGESF
jgi:translocation and assembly module TamA